MTGDFHFCAWCERWFDADWQPVAGLQLVAVSHGICPACAHRSIMQAISLKKISGAVGEVKPCGLVGSLTNTDKAAAPASVTLDPIFQPQFLKP